MAGLIYRDAATLSDEQRLDELASLLAVGLARLLGIRERNALDACAADAALCVCPVSASEKPGTPDKEAR